MNVYVETNFVLELALLQEESASCASLVDLCEAGEILLVIPAYSLAEPYETLTRRHRKRRDLKDQLDYELQQLSRSANHEKSFDDFLAIADLLVKSESEEIQQLEQVRSRIAQCARVVPLTTSILNAVMEQKQRHDLDPQDALVYASILEDLMSLPTSDAVFLTRNSRDFDTNTIHEELEDHECKLLTSFEHGLGYIRSRLETSDPPEA